MSENINLEEYEKVLEDHGTVAVYYPKAIIQETLRKKLIEQLHEHVCVGTLQSLRPLIEDIVNETILGY